MNSVLKPAGSTKYISEVAEKLKIAVKKQENQVILSLLNQGDTFRDLQKTCDRRQVLPHKHETMRKFFEKI